MAMRYKDDVNAAKFGGVRRRSMPLQRPESIAQERVRQDPDAIELDEHRGVADEPERDAPSAPVTPRRASRRRPDRSTAPAPGAAGAGAAGA